MSDRLPDDAHLSDDGHAGDLVSAHVDGELDEATERWVEDHLAGCETCRTAAAHARAAKELLARPAPVDAGPVVEGFLGRHRAVIRTGTAFVGAAMVALGALAISSAVLHPEVVPDVDAMVGAHAATTEALRTEGLAPPALAGMGSVRPTDRVTRHYVVPPALGGADRRLDRQALFDGPDLTVAVYGEGRSAVSVFEQPGSLEWDQLPPGSFDHVAGRRVWIRESRPAALVAEVGDLVITVVSHDRAALAAVVEGLPAKERGSTWDRLHDACMRFTAAFTAR